MYDGDPSCFMLGFAVGLLGVKPQLDVTQGIEGTARSKCQFDLHHLYMVSKARLPTATPLTPRARIHYSDSTEICIGTGKLVGKEKDRAANKGISG